MIGTTEFKVTAVLDTEGAASVQVSGICAYGDRTAHRAVDITDEKALASVASVLKKTIEGVREELGKAAQMDAMESATVALKRGESLVAE